MSAGYFAPQFADLDNIMDSIRRFGVSFSYEGIQVSAKGRRGELLLTEWALPVLGGALFL